MYTYRFVASFPVFFPFLYVSRVSTEFLFFPCYCIFVWRFSEVLDWDRVHNHLLYLYVLYVHNLR